jgi:geranylgeranyl reductase family protein
LLFKADQVYMRKGFFMGQNASHVYDAIVVGAGPAGSSAALFLSRAGKKVLLIDKAFFPREKVCGDAFSGKSIGIAAELGLIDSFESQPHAKIRSLTMVAPNGKAICVPFPNASGMEFAGYTIERIRTDNIFLSAALSDANITVRQNFAVSSLLRSGDAVCGVCGKDATTGKEESFFGRVVVGADGAASNVSRLVGLPNVPLNHVFSAVRGYWENVEGLSDSIELYFIDEVLPGYLWIFPLGNKRANIGLGMLSSDLIKRKKHPNAILLDALKGNPRIASRMQNARQVGKIGAWSIPAGSYVKQNAGDGWVLVGDAAALVDPFSGEGVGNALCSGKYAAQAIASALEKFPGNGPLPKSALIEYSKAVDANLRGEMADSYRLQRLSRFKFLLNLFISKAADKPEFRQVVINMIGSDEAKKNAQSPLFFLKLFLP